jgi:MFS family permease
VFFTLVLPYGTSFGYVSLALPFLATRTAIDPAEMATVVALAFVPHTWKCLWAPIVDTTLTRKTWYVIALALTMLGTIVSASMPIRPELIGALTVVVMASQIGLTLMGMSCDSFMALTVPEAEKGRAAGWYQAGAFAGNGIGGWAALELSGALPEGWMVGAVMAATMLVSAIALLFIPKLPRGAEHARKLRDSLRGLGRDLWELVLSRKGLTGLIIGLSPVGAGALMNTLVTIPQDWGLVEGATWKFLWWELSAKTVIGALSGLLGGAISAGGCVFGGWLADRMNRRLAYGLAGFMTATTGLLMALSPRTPTAYVVYVLIYSLWQGVAFATYAAFVLDTIGKGNVATKYTIFASLANVAITYMTFANGRGLKLWGATGAVLTDSVLTFAGIAVLLAMVAIVRRWPESVADDRSNRPPAVGV